MRLCGVPEERVSDHPMIDHDEAMVEIRAAMQEARRAHGDGQRGAASSADDALITSDERIARSLKAAAIRFFVPMRNVAVGRPAPGQSRRRWRGDEEHRLPAQKVEPYRLWFEFLKLASKDPEIQIDKRFYQRWGSVDAADFDDWWSAHWRDLFSVDIGVRVCEPGEGTEKRIETAISFSNSSLPRQETDPHSDCRAS